MADNFFAPHALYVCADRVSPSNIDPDDLSYSDKRYTCIAWGDPDASVDAHDVGGNMTNVLVVDDSDDIRLALRTILEEVGHDVHELSDGIEVLPWLQSNSPDMILLDVAMPLKDGFQTLSELIADSRYAHIPVIKVTAKGRTQDLERARSLQARDYISKPWEDGEVELRTGWILEAATLRRAS